MNSSTAINNGTVKKLGSLGVAMLVAMLVAWAGIAAQAEQPAPAQNVPADERPQREIFVPFADLHVILSADVERVFVTREEYEDLAAKARKASRPEATRQPAALLSADYSATIEENRARLLGKLVVTASDDSLSAVELDLSGVALRSATLDDKPAALGRNRAGVPVLFVGGAGRHELKLEILAPVETAAAQRTLSFQIPTPPATRLRLAVPGYVEIKSGATIIQRGVDEQQQVTRFDLLPRRGQNSLVLSLNNRQLRKERVVVVQAVLIDEITTAYERLHVTASLSVLHGATDQFRFVVPAGFEVTSVNAPQVARWAVTTEEDRRILDVRLREALAETVSLNIAAVRTPAPLDQWSLPKLVALDVAGEATVVGLLLENRLKPYDLRPKNLISIDASVLAQTMPASVLEAQAGAPAVVPVAAFYAPRGDFEVQARFTAPPADFRVTTNVLLTLTEEKLEARGGFALVNATDKLLDFDFSSPAGWQVTEVVPEGGAALPLETYPGADGSSRVHVRLSQGAPIGQSRTVYFRAVSAPEGWLDEWRSKNVAFPTFHVAGTTRDVGAIAVQTRDDMLARADQVARLTPLDANEKNKYGLEDVATELAYRYEAPGYALGLAVSRVEPRLTARAFSFFRVEPDLLTAHYEIAYDVSEARTGRLTFALADSTPAELVIRGLDGVTIKESSSAVEDQLRRWTVLLGESRRGAIRLAVDFQQPLGQPANEQPKEDKPEKQDAKDSPTAAELTSPLIRALNVAYQSGTVAVEGSAQADVQVETSLRKVDVGELAEADYQIGRRLLGAYGYGGDKAEVKLTIKRPQVYELPTAIVERAELLTAVSASGRSQTVARFQLRAKALLIEVQLPEGSTLWSAWLDGEPTLPQREGGSLLIGLPATAEARQRNLQLAYETPVAQLGMVGSLQLAAPKLLLRASRGVRGEEVPLADLVWNLSTPGDFKVVRSRGTVFNEYVGRRESPLLGVLGAIGGIFSADEFKRAARPETALELRDLEKFDVSGVPIDPTELSTSTLTMEAPQDAEKLAGGAPAPKAPPNFTSDLVLPIPQHDAKQAVDGKEKDGKAKSLEQFDNFRQSFNNLRKEQNALESDKDDMLMAKAPAKASPRRDAVPAEEDALEKTARAKHSVWALEGVRSLPIELQASASQTSFQSLGEQPRLDVTLVDGQRFKLLAWCVALVVIMRGVLLTSRPRGERARFVAAVLVVSLALPWVLPWSGLFAPLCNMAFYAGCWLVVYYLAAGILKRIARLGRSASHHSSQAHAATAVVVLLMLMARSTSAEDMPTPVKVPADAIIVPYDPEKDDPLKVLDAAAADAKPNGEPGHGKRFGSDKSQKLLVPYDKYHALRNAVHPDDKKPPAPPADYALGGGEFTVKLDDARLDGAKLNGGESLLIEGHLDVDVLVDHAVSVPLRLAGGVLTKAKVVGEPGEAAIFKPAAVNQPPVANQQPVAVKTPKGKGPPAPGQPAAGQPAPGQPAAGQPGESPWMLIVTGPGRKRVELAIRFRLQRRGGWQIAEGRLPVPLAAALTLQIAKSGTEVALTGGVDRGNFETRRDNETVETALAADGAFHLQWRAKAGPAPVDQGLTARSAVALDVQEDGLRLVWRFDLQFRRGQRESFTIDVPEGYLVEKVAGGNVRGWKLDEAAGRRRLEVTLLKAALDAESFAVTLSLRGAVGSGELANVTAPVLSVSGAAQQSGELVIRRSPLLELRTEQTNGVSRADAGASKPGAGDEAEESPLGILPYQVYRFAATPFVVKLSARPVTPRVSAELQTVLRISERQRTLESRLRVRVDERPIYRLRIAVPEDWKLDRVTAPEPFEWVESRDGQRRLLNLYFAAGQRQSFDVVLSGMLGDYGPAESVALPKLEVVDADELAGGIQQTGEIAVEADPSLNVRAEKLVHCETVLLARVNAWLNPAQQKLARLAIAYRAPDYSAQLQLSPRKPIVRCDTFSNIRVTEHIVEETILLDFSIHEAGIRSLSFLLPKSMQDARISAPMLRQKTVEPAGEADPSRVRVKLELQEEVLNNLRVLVENDRLLTGETYSVPIPLVETGQTDHRYVTLESAGRDEIVVAAHEGVDPLGQEQAEWRMLTAMLGRGLTQAYLVRPNAAQPLLALRAQDRAAVETAGARIGLAKTTLVIDEGGAYRGAQLYRVDNGTEQYLEIQLPAGARLWTAHVAGEPVKPAAAKAAGTVRIPLVKTAPGDTDYAVVLKYGGQLGRLGVVDRLNFPLIRSLNIHVELSQVELYLPETYDWFNFGGTMRLVESEGDLAAGWLAYNTKQIEQARQALHSEDVFAKARAVRSILSLQSQSERMRESAGSYANEGNRELAEQLKTNVLVQKDLAAEVNEPKVANQAATELDNRGRLNNLYRSQSNSRANDVVNEAGENFDRAGGDRSGGGAGGGGRASAGEAKGQGLSQQWLAKNKLAGKPNQPPGDGKGEGKNAPAKPQAPGAQFGSSNINVANPQSVAAQPAAPKAFANSEAPPAPDAGKSAQLQEQASSNTRSQRQLQRYTERLAKQQEQQEGLQISAGKLDGSLSKTQIGGGMGGRLKDAAININALPNAPAPTNYAAGNTGLSPAAANAQMNGVVDQAAQSAVEGEATKTPVALASLDVDLQPRGTKYLFTTPRGDVEVTARAVSGSFAGRVARLAVLALGLWLLTVVGRFWVRKGVSAKVVTPAAN